MTSKRDTINIGLLGFGNVGQGVYQILHQNADHVARRVGRPIAIKSIAVRDVKKSRKIAAGDVTLTSKVQDIVNDPEIDIIVELMGGEQPALDYISAALTAKKHVVTANKEVVSKHKKTFFNLAKDNDVDFFYEAAVGGGIPLIKALKVGFAANKIQSLCGILNGTCNYILTQIEETRTDFAEILKKAQELGFAEADPSMDVSGLDAAYKLVILASVAFKTNIQLSDVAYEGIERVTLKDITYADELGYKIKLLARARDYGNGRMSFKVFPTMIPDTHQLSHVRNEFNALFIVGDAVGESMLSGKGAGGSPTGSAVVSDVIDIAFDMDKRRSKRNLDDSATDVDVVPLSETRSQFYLRLAVSDEAGALAEISAALGEADISISTILQKEKIKNTAEVVVITHVAEEGKMAIAKDKLMALGSVKSILSFIRVGLNEDLD